MGGVLMLDEDKLERKGKRVPGNDFSFERR